MLCKKTDELWKSKTNDEVRAAIDMFKDEYIGFKCSQKLENKLMQWWNK